KWKAEILARMEKDPVLMERFRDFVAHNLTSNGTTAVQHNTTKLLTPLNATTSESTQGNSSVSKDLSTAEMPTDLVMKILREAAVRASKPPYVMNSANPVMP